MSEPNFPLKPQAEPGLESSIDWWNPFPELTDSELAKTEATCESPDVQPLALDESASQEVPLTAPVNAYVAPIVVSPSSGVSPAIASPGSASGKPAASEISESLTAALSEQLPQSSEPPNLIDLISLIQELNQCNGVLLDRVSQLEEALERSQQALKGQIERSPEAFATPQSEDLATAQAQIANLFSQLEFAHQTNQRQHILIETLTAELESSQERAAQLEREAALLQQRYNEQVQSLVQSEGTCRDLQARLQRQQRYTLQFKAALEKCLEMPMPQTDSSTEMIAPPIDSLLLPKAQQIQPWSKPVVLQESLLPWMKRFKSADELASLEADQAAAEVAELLSEIAPIEEPKAIEEPVRSKPSTVQLPVLAPLSATASDTAEDQLQEQEVFVEADQTTAQPQAEPIASQFAAEATALEPAPPVSISYDLKTSAGILPSPDLLTQLDAVVQPLADHLVEALLSQTVGPQTVSSQTVSTEAAETEMAETEPMQGKAPEIMAVELPLVESIADPDDVIVSDADRLLASAMSEAEDALWQDLARLIEVAPEEVVKASLTGDLTAFASLNFDESEPPAQPLNPPSINPSSTPAPLNSKPQTGVTEPQISTPPTEPATQKSSIPALAANPNAPSPLLHPFRPVKAKRSLSSVELPSFLQQEDSKPLPT
jgi:hypothetical protein